MAVRFHNVHLRVGHGIVLEVRDLEGALISSDPKRPPTFDDQRSFAVRVDAGTIGISPDSLTRLLNEQVFADDSSSIRDVTVSIEQGRLKQKGTLHKGASIPFSIVADISATPDGLIRLHTVNVKTAGIPSGGLMKLFRIELDDLVKSNKSHGLQIVDNDVLISPDRLLSAPTLRGRMSAIRIEGDRIVQTYGTRPSRGSDRERRNYMQYRGGTLRFGKLTMSDTDMELIDADPRDPFDFWPERYVTQLVAGYSKNTPSGGLRVYMPDYESASRADLKPPAVLD